MNLTSVLVASGLIGVLAVVMTRLLSDSSKHQKSIQMKNDVESVKMLLMRRVNCEETTSELGLTCKPGALIELKEKRGGDVHTIVRNEDPPTRFGKIAVRAECSPDGDGVMVKYAWLRDGKSIQSENLNDFYSDLIFNEKLSWNNDKTNLLFQTGVNICTLGTDSSNLPMCYVGNSCRSASSSRPFAIYQGEKLKKIQSSLFLLSGGTVSWDSSSYGRKIVCTNWDGDNQRPVCENNYFFSGVVSYTCVPGTSPNMGSICTGSVADTILCCKK